MHLRLCARMPRLFFEAPTRVKCAMLLFVVLPCVPGAIFLLVGMMRDPLWPAQDMTPVMWTEYHRAAQQTRGLYKAGAAVLGVGLLCGMAVVWQIVRQREDDEEEDHTE